MSDNRYRLIAINQLMIATNVLAAYCFIWFGLQDTASFLFVGNLKVISRKINSHKSVLIRHHLWIINHLLVHSSFAVARCQYASISSVTFIVIVVYVW